MRRAAKVDRVAPALVKLVKQHGADWLPWPGGPIDGFILWRRRIIAVDWKSQGGTLTPTQSKLVAKGWPIWFIGTAEDVQLLLTQEGRL